MYAVKEYVYTLEMLNKNIADKFGLRIMVLIFRKFPEFFLLPLLEITHRLTFPSHVLNRFKNYRNKERYLS